MSVPTVHPNPVDNVSTTTPASAAASRPIPQVQDSIQTPPKASRWSWSYIKIATVSIVLIAACTVAAFVMKHIFKNADRAAEYDSRLGYYRDLLTEKP